MERQGYSISNLFFQDKQIYKKHSADNRKFIIRQNNKDKVVYGYRGDGSEMGRRALPVEDARCMVNLCLFRPGLKDYWIPLPEQEV